jgi:predicted RNA-binding protein with PUA-like domain
MPAKAAPRHWLFKSEPDVFSIADLERAPGRTTFWDGVRNYQARNFLRDDVKKGDFVLFYHSNAEPPHVAGTAIVVREAYPDPTQFDPADPHFDPKAKPDAPPWVVVEIKHAKTFRTPVDRSMLAADKATAGMEVLRRGSRLSIQPVTAAEYRAVVALGG